MFGNGSSVRARSLSVLGLCGFPPLLSEKCKLRDRFRIARLAGRRNIVDQAHAFHLVYESSRILGRSRREVGRYGLACFTGSAMS